MSYRETIAELDALSRTRALTLSESLALERAITNEIKYASCPSYKPRWSREEDKRLFELMGRGRSDGTIARLLGRTSEAVKGRRRYLAEQGVSSL